MFNTAETRTALQNSDLYRGLYAQNPTLFWFFADVAEPPRHISELGQGLQLATIQLQAGHDRVLSFSSIEGGVELDIDVAAGTVGSSPEKKLNEDSILAVHLSRDRDRKRDLFAVIDGASSQLPITGLEPHKVSGAFYISHLVSHGFPKSELFNELCARENLTAVELVAELNTWIKTELEKIPGVDYSNVLTIPGAAATFAIVDLDSRTISIAHIADTVALLQRNGASSEVEVLTDNKNRRFDDETMALASQLATTRGFSLAEAAQSSEVKAQLKASFTSKINTAGGCGILNGMPELINNDLAQAVTIEFGDLVDEYRQSTETSAAGGTPAKQLILTLASDGYYTAFSSSDAAQSTAGMGLVSNAGLVEEVRCRFLDDPEHAKFPRLKFVDDITYVTIKIVIGRDQDERESSQQWQNRVRVKQWNEVA